MSELRRSKHAEWHRLWARLGAVGVAVVAAVALALGTAAPARAAPSEGGASSAAASSGAPPSFDVRLHEHAVFALHVARAGQSAQDRARAASRALESVARRPRPTAERASRRAGPTAVVFVGKTPIVTLGDDDAEAAGGDVTLHVYAASVESRIDDALRTERRRSAIAEHVFSLSLLVFSGAPRVPPLPPRRRSLGPRAHLGARPSRSHPGAQARADRGRPAGRGPRRRLHRPRPGAPPRAVRHRLLVAHLRALALRGDAGLHRPARGLRPRAAVGAHRARRVGAAALRRRGHRGGGPRRRGALRRALLRARRTRRDARHVAPARARGADERPRTRRDGARVDRARGARSSRAPTTARSRARASWRSSALGLACTPVLACAAAGVPAVFGRRLRPGRLRRGGRPRGRRPRRHAPRARPRGRGRLRGPRSRSSSVSGTRRASSAAAPLASIEVVVDPRERPGEVEEALVGAAVATCERARVDLVSLDADGARWRVSGVPKHGKGAARLADAVAQAIADQGIALGRGPTRGRPDEGAP